ncbi:transcriptional regulator [Haemophilus parainfluenzae]|uniref:Transcriptional regulator n=2 Tax=Haemophilus parainfluenzae TaxID=729 RepID=A0A377JIQ0_HAEPA|nr:transcriptional regulator [Haemophilus parainfluenzae]
MLKRDKMRLNRKQIYARLRNLSILNRKWNAQMCISERLRQVCEAKNWKITDFAEQAGIAYRTMQGYIGGEREPNAEGMSGIAKAGVNLNWLVSGEGEMFQAVMPKNTISAQEEKLIADYRTMPENLKDAFAISFKEISEKQ